MNVSKLAKKGLLYTQTGTPYYASPEVWKEQPYDAKSDMWSLGCVVYEMAALRPPFRAEDREGLCKKVLIGEYKPIPDFFSRELGEMIDHLLQVNPSKRLSSGSLKADLRSNAETTSGHFSPPSRPYEQRFAGRPSSRVS